MLLSFVFLLISLFVVIKSANFAIRYSISLAENLNLPKYIIGFVVVAIISILPETFISVVSALEQNPSFGLGTLFGSNVADLTFVFFLVVFLSGKNLKIKSRLIKNQFLHIGAIMVPILLGLNGFYSRFDGLVLIAVGLLFYYFMLKEDLYTANITREKFRIENLLFLLLSMVGLLAGSHLTVKYGVHFANSLQISPILIGMLIVGVGTTLPELFFSVKAAKKHQNDLALGDILGTVVADATIVVGIMALIHPFAFNSKIVFVTGSFMLAAMFLLFYFMASGRVLNKKEALMLFIFYVVFVMTEFFVNN